ncbi:hypothetical protein [Streptomyces milbemycinicus]|uniref:Uncharacterized protein n=1 Tax=Streptomyces milbemycinicus TaxID=476552 RepID=A0ABW8LC85_9ACTN
MSAQPDHSVDRKVTAIPHTINAIGEALSGEQRARFYGEVLAAEESVVPAVMRSWWKIAMLAKAPLAEHSRANAAAGRNLVSIDDLMSRLEGAGG